MIGFYELIAKIKKRPALYLGKESISHLQVFLTEIDIAEELVKMGVPKQEIVVGFHHPFMRKLSDYAVG